MNQPTATTLAEIVRESSRVSGPADRALATLCVLDWLGVVLAAADDEIAGVMRRVTETQGTAPFGSAATELAGNTKRSPGDAALVNGCLAHVLDYDDVHFDVPGHCGAPVVAAALAVGESIGANWVDVEQAVVVGVEVMCSLGRATGARQYERGWHPTAVLGGFGSLAATATILQLSDAELERGFAAVAVDASGMLGAFGSHGKSWQVGRSAQRGVQAGFAAASGLQVNADILDCRYGFGDLYVPGEPLDLEPERNPTQLSIQETIFKTAASCFATHAAIAAARDCALDQVNPGAISSITITIGPQFADIITRGVGSGLALKFDVAAIVAMVTLGADLADPSAYSDRAAASPELAALRSRIRVVQRETFQDSETSVCVYLNSGEVRTAHAAQPRAAQDIDSLRGPLLRKFMANSGPVLSGDDARHVWTAPTEHDANLPVREFLSLVTGGMSR